MIDYMFIHNVIATPGVFYPILAVKSDFSFSSANA